MHSTSQEGFCKLKISQKSMGMQPRHDSIWLSVNCQRLLSAAEGLVDCSNKKCSNPQRSLQRLHRSSLQFPRSLFTPVIRSELLTARHSSTTREAYSPHAQGHMACSCVDLQSHALPPSRRRPHCTAGLFAVLHTSPTHAC